MRLGKYSFGIGDRFNHQGKAQLKALMMARDAGLEIIPVWNKSNREHQIVKSTPDLTRQEADEATMVMNWDLPYFVDADHINLFNVDKFIEHCDFFTIDVAEYISKPAVDEDVEEYIENNRKYTGKLHVTGIDDDFTITEDFLAEIGFKFLNAAQEAGKIYRYINKRRSGKDFITEISMDEVDNPQTPAELLFILGMLANEKIPLQTIAPKFTGRFNKGIDYSGDPAQFRQEFEQDLLVIDHAVNSLGLPDNLKLSIHSGSDKFTIYPIIGDLIAQYDKGIHLKTAGTTWLEEIIGLAEADEEGFNLVKEIYRDAYSRKDELCKPYSAVIRIEESSLPSPDTVHHWDSNKFINTLRHVPDHPDYNPNLRQLIHVGYKVAAEMDERYVKALKKYAEVIGKNVTENIYERHLQRLFKF